MQHDRSSRPSPAAPRRDDDHDDPSGPPAVPVGGIAVRVVRACRELESTLLRALAPSSALA